MFRYRRALPGGFRTRLGVFAGGLLIACYGASLFSRGSFVFHNYLRAEVYSPAVVVTGGVLMMVALVPDSLVEKLMKRGRGNNSRYSR
jgi:hypothetical protein